MSHWEDWVLSEANCSWCWVSTNKSLLSSSAAEAGREAQQMGPSSDEISEQTPWAQRDAEPEDSGGMCQPWFVRRLLCEPVLKDSPEEGDTSFLGSLSRKVGLAERQMPPCP